MSTHYLLLQRLSESFDQLYAKIECLQQQLTDEQPACWMHGQPEAYTHAALTQALADFWYLDGQDGRVTRSYPGLVACSAPLWERVTQVNLAKQHFFHQLEAIKLTVPQALHDARAQITQRHQQVHRHLTQEGLARLHLKQTWRQLPQCERPLNQVRFSWYSSGRSIRKLSVQEAEQHLLALNTDAPHIRIQLHKLASVPPDEPLAQVQKQAPLMRANLFFAAQDSGMSKRQAMNIAMPLFLFNPEGLLPRFNQPALTPPVQRTRARRADNCLEDEPFLPSLRIYRYAQRPQVQTAPDSGA